MQDRVERKCFFNFSAVAFDLHILMRGLVLAFSLRGVIVMLLLHYTSRSQCASMPQVSIILLVVISSVELATETLVANKI